MKIGSPGLDAARQPGDDGREGMYRVRASSPFETRRHQLAEAFRAVADLVLQRGVHFAEGDVVAERAEDRVVAEAERAAFLVDDLALDPGLEQLAVAIGPAQRQRADEAGTAVALRIELAEHAVHREIEVAFAVAVLVGPARGVDAGRA